MIKLIVTDLDGTLLEEDKSVRLRNREALIIARQYGCEICIASARMHSEIEQLVNWIPKGCYSISQNGSFICTQEGNLLKEFCFDSKIARQIIDFAKRFDFLCIVSCTDQKTYTPRKTEFYAALEYRMFIPCQEKVNLRELIGQHLWASKFSFYGNLQELLEFKNSLIQRFGSQINVEISDKDCLDVMPSGVSKGSGMLTLMQTLGLQPDEIICIGDSYNDVSMFGVTPHSFIMAQSDETLKLHAKHVVYSVEEAVSWALSYNSQLRATGTELN